MKLVIKKYTDLSRNELYEILRLRNEVFIVEQACPYQDIDETDKTAYHVFLQNEDGIQAYLRVFREDPASKEA
ncbi:MAG: GNAT family N-acetyltransferase, partial [Oscillospiraceae bacterium]|nr:GNAT family N-acetyltransferase [Oscillospiraceae bacterium]